MAQEKIRFDYAMSSHEPAAPSTNLTRKQLYLLVWEQPLSHLAKAFGVSGHDLAKIVAKGQSRRNARSANRTSRCSDGVMPSPRMIGVIGLPTIQFGSSVPPGI
jgi:hypothetical protein